MTEQYHDADTITFAALLTALQVAIEAGAHSPADLASLERQILKAITRLEPDEFGYAEQASGIGEALQLVRGIFRRCHADFQAPVR